MADYRADAPRRAALADIARKTREAAAGLVGSDSTSDDTSDTTSDDPSGGAAQDTAGIRDHELTPDA